MTNNIPTELLPQACPSPHLYTAHCVNCVARSLATRSLEDVHSWWIQGVIDDDALDAYRHVWALSATRSKTYDHWMDLPATSEGRAIAKALTALLPSGRGYC